jgi:hypothetical protein
MHSHKEELQRRVLNFFGAPTIAGSPAAELPFRNAVVDFAVLLEPHPRAGVYIIECNVNQKILAHCVADLFLCAPTAI